MRSALFFLSNLLLVSSEILIDKSGKTYNVFHQNGKLELASYANKTFAVKKVKSHGKESQILDMLSTAPNVVQKLDEIPRTNSLVLEYAPFKSLEKHKHVFMQRDGEIWKQMLLEAVSAVSQVHRAGLCHNDLHASLSP